MLLLQPVLSHLVRRWTAPPPHQSRQVPRTTIISVSALLGANLTIDLGEKASDNDTLNLTGINNLGLSVIDLSAADQIMQVNGVINSAIQTGIESVSASAVTGSGAFNIVGNAENNTITGSKNSDAISLANGGNDTIVFKAAASNGNDAITNFTSGTVDTTVGGDVLNLIGLSSATFAILDAGSTTISGVIGATVANTTGGAGGTAIDNKLFFVDDALVRLCWADSSSDCRH